jgi:antitoxin Phd
MTTWQVQEAKAQLSKVIEFACMEGAQIITHHGKDRAVVLSIAEYQTLLEHKADFKTYLLGGPKVSHFTVKRKRDTGRAVKL